MLVRRWLSIFSVLVSSAAAAVDVVAASSEHSAPFAARFAADGDLKTRWASKPGEPEATLTLDLGRTVPVRDLRIHWEAAYAADYEVLVSTDGEKWTPIHHQTQGQGGVESIAGLNGRGRYLKLSLHKPGPFPLYSVWEIELLNPEAAQALAKRNAPAGTLSATILKKQQRRLARQAAEAGAENIVFATREPYADGHWYANISYYAADENNETYTHGGGLYVLHTRTGRIRPLIEDADGTLRDPAVHYDGKTILFSWRKGGDKSFHLYTIQSDGSGLRQLTNGGYDDIEPAWMPDGGIVFVSTRSRRWVNCWLTQVATVHRCNADGSNITPISANLEQDNTPWPLPDGRILYMRWEYVDRSQVDYHHLWTMHPDGAGQSVFFGNLHPSGLFIDAKPVPGTQEVLTINSPGHGAREHAGHVAIVTPDKGPDDLPSMKNIALGEYRDPYPISANTFIAARKNGMVLLSRKGDAGYFYRLDAAQGKRELHEPRPILAHAPERVMPPVTQPETPTGKVVLVNANQGRNMPGVQPGEIKRLLVLESLPKPINYTGGMDPLTYGGSFTLERVLGTVPVESDGSAYLELPANRALFFVAQDAQGHAVKRMQSFMTVAPGETVSCVGCHENRAQTAANVHEPKLQALARPASAPEPVPGIPEVFDFPRDIQPILDRHCVGCHDSERHPGFDAGPRAGGVTLSGDHGPMFSLSYVDLTVHGQIADGRDRAVSNLAPRTIGAVASPLMNKVDGTHHGVRLSKQEVDCLTYWIETGAPYPGTYGALGCGVIGAYYANEQGETDFDWPESKQATEVFNAQCAACHKDALSLPRQLSDEAGLSFWRPEWNDPRLLRSRHVVYNLSRPDQSLIVLAPLAREAGGYGLCKNADGAPAGPFKDKNDAGYRALLAMIERGKARLETIKRFDMPGFRPPEPYIREMVRYRVLPEKPDANVAVDPYACDRLYWQSFEQERAQQHEAYANAEAQQKK